MTNIDELKSTGLKPPCRGWKILEIFPRPARQRHLDWHRGRVRVLLDEHSDIGLQPRCTPDADAV